MYYVFQATCILVANIWRQHFSAEGGLIEITISHKVAQREVEKKKHCKDTGI
jgi:hypothetical protein